MRAEQDRYELREIKVRLENLVAYYRGVVGPEHAFVVTLEARLATLAEGTDSRGRRP